MAAKKNEVYPLRIEGYGSAGEGVARLDGQAVFVKGALAGELCQVQLLKVGKSAAWGRVAEVTEPSPGRQVPDCPQYPKCGGCQLLQAPESPGRPPAHRWLGRRGLRDPRRSPAGPVSEQDPVPRGRRPPRRLFPRPEP